jgi:hypothetical protein
MLISFWKLRKCWSTSGLVGASMTMLFMGIILSRSAATWAAITDLPKPVGRQTSVFERRAVRAIASWYDRRSTESALRKELELRSDCIDRTPPRSVDNVSECCVGISRGVRHGLIQLGLLQSFAATSLRSRRTERSL